MCGFAGQHWFKKKGTKFARITGLDPCMFNIIEFILIPNKI